MYRKPRNFSIASKIRDPNFTLFRTLGQIDQSFDPRKEISWTKRQVYRCVQIHFYIRSSFLYVVDIYIYTYTHIYISVFSIRIVYDTRNVLRSFNLTTLTISHETKMTSIGVFVTRVHSTKQHIKAITFSWRWLRKSLKLINVIKWRWSLSTSTLITA